MTEKPDLLKFEKELIKSAITVIAGMDEAGRGPLAGPVTAACCIMDLSQIIEGINDSKKLTAKKRETLEAIIKEKAIGFSLVDIDEKTIDEINILNATKQAMTEAVRSLLPYPEFLLVDAVKHDFGVPYKAIIHGDALSYSIAAASILAKVHRDRLMEKYAEIYPQYGFERHKGYGTAEHIKAIREYGPCPIHRRTFIKNFLGENNG